MSACRPGPWNSRSATRPSVLAPTSMTARSFSMPTIVPLTTDPSCGAPCVKDSSSIAAKSSRVGAEAVAVAMYSPDGTTGGSCFVPPQHRSGQGRRDPWQPLGAPAGRPDHPNGRDDGSVNPGEPRLPRQKRGLCAPKPRAYAPSIRSCGQDKLNTAARNAAGYSQLDPVRQGRAASRRAEKAEKSAFPGLFDQFDGRFQDRLNTHRRGVEEMGVRSLDQRSR